MKPLKSTERAKELVVELWKTREFVRRGERHFVGDRRYDLQFISDGFASRIDNSDGDPALFERICASYQKAAHQEQSAPEIYRASQWWQERRQGNLKPVIAALLNGDIAAPEDVHQFLSRSMLCRLGYSSKPGKTIFSQSD